MSLTLVIWLLLFLGLTIASFQRPVYAIALYMLTFFLCPPFWWWGDSIDGYRWSLYSGFILIVAVAMHSPPAFSRLDPRIRLVLKIAMLIAVNATFVHLVMAGGSKLSSDSYTLTVKFILLLSLVFAAIKSKADFRIAIAAILLGATYIGYEVTINDRGRIVSNRLEGVGAPGASSANHFASLMVATLPLVAPFFLAGRIPGKILSLIAAPFILNVILLCNSRGAFLAAIFSAFVFIAAAPKGIRGKAWKLIAFGALATFMLLGDSRIVDRFLTTFASEEERDGSAQSRIDFAMAGLAMVTDYPLGAGGDGYKKLHGIKYLRKLEITDTAHSIHNGFINEACEWGIQGALLRYGLYAMAILATWQTLKQSEPETSEVNFDKLAGCAILSGCSAFLVTCLFGDHLDSEWGLWLVALMLAYVSLNTSRSDLTRYDDDEDFEEEFIDDLEPNDSDSPG